ncbi:MAG TPA: response regulator [Desulfomonilaceae bacterium]|nr:response regulator [Desulfomonilaceae bacterium]
MAEKRNSLFVVDDDSSVRAALKRLLEALGFNVKTFKSAEEFLDSGLAQCPDLLILDVRMTGMTGLELQRTLIEQGSDIPVIFVTAYDDMNARRVAMEAGAVAFVQKPFDEEILVDAIQRGLGRQPQRVPSQVNSE